MNEIEFRNWLIKKGTKKKVVSDTISRLKRIEREIENCDIDDQYRSNRCEQLLNLFVNRGNNKEMYKYSTGNILVGKCYMNTYRYALKKYIQFCDNTL